MLHGHSQTIHIDNLSSNPLNNCDISFVIWLGWGELEFEESFIINSDETSSTEFTKREQKLCMFALAIIPGDCTLCFTSIGYYC